MFVGMQDKNKSQSPAELLWTAVFLSDFPVWHVRQTLTVHISKLAHKRVSVKAFDPI